MPARARAVAAELKQLREEHSGLNTIQAARRLGMSPTTLNRSETGRRLATIAEVSALLAVYGITGPERRRIMSLVENIATSGWWDTNYKHTLLHALMQFEQQASAIIAYSPTLIPGLLQTPNYARAIIGSKFSGDELDQRVDQRLQRQRVLSKSPALRYHVILDEAALRRPFGGRYAMADQIRWIIDAVKVGRATVNVIPFKHGGYDASSSFSILEFPRLPRLVYIQAVETSGFLDATDETDRFPVRVSRMMKLALNSADSVNFMSKVVADHERS
jgi:transcriptional regulator with XRE-family HTH domain